MSNIITSAGLDMYNQFDKSFGIKVSGPMEKAIIDIENEMRQIIADMIEDIDLGGPSQINGLGMKMLALEVARGTRE